MNAFPSLNSEEAKSTTWLHPVSGEAVITGHRKTPGKVSLDSGQVSLLSHGWRHALLLPVSQSDTSHTGREAVTSVFLMHEWASGAVKSQPPHAHLCPVRATTS